jgi:hypothetical protein
VESLSVCESGSSDQSRHSCLMVALATTCRKCDFKLGSGVYETFEFLRRRSEYDAIEVAMSAFALSARATRWSLLSRSFWRNKSSTWLATCFRGVMNSPVQSWRYEL